MIDSSAYTRLARTKSSSDILPESPIYIAFLIYAHLPIPRQIRLVADHDDWHRRSSLRLVYLVPQRPDLLERSRVRDVVHQYERVGGGYRQGPHRGELVRPRRVQDVEGQVDPGHVEVAVVHLLDRALVLRGEGAVEELGDEGGLADLCGTHDDDFVADVARGGAVVVFLGGFGVLAALRPEKSVGSFNVAGAKEAII